MIKQAIFHVENTEGLVDFARFLSDFGWTILSANKTEELLKKEKVPVQHEQALSDNNLYLTETTAFMQKIMASTFMDEPGVNLQHNTSIGIVCINFQPAIHSINSPSKLQNLLNPFYSYISSILRNTFLNYENILILCDPADYKEAMVQLRTNSIDPDFRLYLAAKALNLVSAFDGGVANSILMHSNSKKEFINYLTYPFERQFVLHSGSNQQQDGCLYRFPGMPGTLGTVQKQQGKELSYNTISDISFAWEQISILSTTLKNQFSVKSVNCDGYKFETQFTPLTGTVFTIAIKHKSILGATLSTNILDSFKNTYTYDAEKIQQVTLAASSVIDEAAATAITSCGPAAFAAIAAPGFTPGAKEILSQNKKLELIQVSKIITPDFNMELINGGLLFQTKDKRLFDHWDVKTKNRPGQVYADQMAFGTILAMASRSYSAVLLKNNTVVGISQACKTPERAVDVVLAEALIHRQHNNQDDGGVLADVLVTDTAIPLCDSIKKLTDAGLKAIIQPGGLPGDKDFVDYCNDHLISMIFTGMSHISY